MKLKTFVALLCCLALPVAAAPICTPGQVANTLECSLYVVVPNGSPQASRQFYSALVPAGETRPLRISHAFMNSQDQYYGGAHVLLIESPANTSWWKVPLAWTDAYGTRSRANFTPPVSLNRNEALCLQSYSAYGVSYAIHYTIGP